MRRTRSSARRAISALAISCAAALFVLAAHRPSDAADAQTSAPDLTPYDAGYASQAAASCPGVTLTAELSAETKADPDFKRGQDMFSRYVETMKPEGACKAALKLYDAETGKVRKVLRQK